MIPGEYKKEKYEIKVKNLNLDFNENEYIFDLIGPTELFKNKK
jgi:hypothetical protein